MKLSAEEAYEILELPYGTDGDSVRSNYKRLALLWHPDKHQNSPDATKKFQLISAAYKRLTSEQYEESDEDEIVMSMSDMFDLFQQIFFAKAMANAYNGYDIEDDDDDDDDYDDDDDDDDDDIHVDYVKMLTGQMKLKQDYRKPRPDLGQMNKRLTPEEIKKNAEELVEEEEKEKRKAEKRRAKKKRRREKKKLEKIAADQEKKDDLKSNSQKKDQSNDKERGKGGLKKSNKNKKDKTGSAEEADFDPSAAFFTKVVNKKKKGVEVLPTGSKKDKKDKQQNSSQSLQGSSKNVDDAEDLDPLVLRSRQLAIRGNEMANLGHYNEAIDLFTEAIKLDGSDFRFFGNRSYCYDRVLQYEKALRDAEKAISLSPDWPKGHFRKGRAFAGLKLYADAEQAFMQVLKLDRNCEDAMQELIRVRTHKLTEMGFSQKQAESAIRQYGTVQAALDSLLAGVAENSLQADAFLSDDDDFNEPTPSPILQHQHLHPIPAAGTSDTKMDPGNPEGLTALWVGNVLPEVSEKKLTQMFAKFGAVTSVRCLPEKYCAFVNFKSKESAGRAMHTLQGMECAGQRLLVKFPDNPIQNGNVVIKKGSTSSSSNASVTVITKQKPAPVVAKPVVVQPPPPQPPQVQPVSVAAAAAAAAAAANRYGILRNKRAR
ncbi:nucleolin-like isoform X2 [Lineus longissimus]|uniref:nucleolin-like isoform X2 n=1 Tax=Lineus longissimus TaxID=88925 RepID=UPI00315D81B8